MAFFFAIAAASATFYLEPLIPPGDWRWIVIAVACLAIGLWLSRSIADMGTVGKEHKSTLVQAFQSLDSYYQGIIVVFFMMTFMSFMRKLADWLFAVKENGGMQ